MGCGWPPGAVVPPWLVWTARTVGRGGGAAVGLRVFHDTQQATFEDITVKDILIFYYMCKDMFILNLSESLVILYRMGRCIF